MGIVHLKNPKCFRLQDALDVMGDKIEHCKDRWQAESTKIQEENKRLLLEFGLNPLDI